MPTSTYVPLATLTLTGNDSSVVFSSIPATYRDLILVSNLRASETNTSFLLLNNSSSGFSFTRAIAGSFGIIGSSYATNEPFPTLNGTGQLVLQIMDYSATDKHKTMLIRTDLGSIGRVDMLAGRWANNAAVNQITINSNSPFVFVSGATFSLYGIAA
jgi:hypothetical protein